jgi:hypothetical protein
MEIDGLIFKKSNGGRYLEFNENAKERLKAFNKDCFGDGIEIVDLY